jgi:hypothetical protein
MRRVQVQRSNWLKSDKGLVRDREDTDTRKRERERERAGEPRGSERE